MSTILVHLMKKSTLIKRDALENRHNKTVLYWLQTRHFPFFFLFFSLDVDMFCQDYKSYNDVLANETIFYLFISSLFQLI